jgi:hypothetical protein
MSILFIDTGWKDLGFALFSNNGEPIDTVSLRFKDGDSDEFRIGAIIHMCETITDIDGLSRVIYENYTVRDDSTGKSKKGQRTLFCNGVVHGFFYGHALLEEMNNRHWSAIYSRYKVDHTLKGLPVLTPPENANEHASDAFKMGVAWLVEKGVIK